MNAEFNWWLLIVGLVAGAGLVWLVIADWSRREEDLSADERAAESAWIAQTINERGERIDPGAAEEVLALHRAYLQQSGVLEADDGASLSDDDITDAPDWSTEPHWATEPDWPDEPGLTRRDDVDGPTAAATTALDGELRPASHESSDGEAPPGGDESPDMNTAPDVNARGTSAMRETSGTDPASADVARPSVRSSLLSPRGGPPAASDHEAPRP